MAESFVDPVVSRLKFAEEVAQWKAHANDHVRRGILLLEDEFPVAFAVFAWPRVRPAHIMFGVELDFTNYDMWPPSVQFVDPLTRQQWPPGVISPIAVLLGGKPAPLFLRFVPDPNDPTALSAQPAVLAQENRGSAFLCMRGVREYHHHPAHSGDSWLQYRSTGIGSLFYLLDKLHEFGIAHIAGMQIGISYVSGGLQQLAPAPARSEAATER